MQGNPRTGSTDWKNVTRVPPVPSHSKDTSPGDHDVLLTDSACSHWVLLITALWAPTRSQRKLVPELSLPCNTWYQGD